MGKIHIRGLKYSGLRVTNRVEVSNDLKKFIQSPEMFIEYDAEIHADKSIQNIPLTATILPLAWLSGSDVYVDALDRTFKESMDRLQGSFKEMLPLAPFNTKIWVDELVDNKIELENPEKHTAQLFSGGVDATYTLISNIKHKPRLIMHWGVEGTPYPVNREYWETVRSIYDAFAKKTGLVYHLTKTNALDVLHDRRIEHGFHKQLYYGTLWARLQHSLVLLSLAAPLSIRRFDRLLIAASEFPEHPNINKYLPHAQYPHLDEQIVWSGLKVSHDGYIPRYRKIRAIADYLEKDPLTLRVCLVLKKEPGTLNCSSCGKCFRTISQLVLIGVDPNKCGFSVDSSTFEKMKTHYERATKLSVHDLDTQRYTPDVIENDMYGSREFYRWFKDLEQKKKYDVWLYRKIYLSLPFPLAEALNKVYGISGIKIYEHMPRLTEEIVADLEASARASQVDLK